MKQADQDRVLKAMRSLSEALNKYHEGSQTTQYVDETIAELEKCQEKAFTGGFEYYIIKAGMLRKSEGIELNEIEYKRWHAVASMKDLGNDLFFGMGM
ncbi:hypothetical protein ACFQAV_13155 [Companilactobacillus huachuanensis]|uniref:Bacteriocin immunity protein n=1 Tax=Companilactobacillus huachuanensis TaxID=2559914 RepID=A0ABW1RQQ8_9LACO|nr:hypothetical protein [Companilactobacillus huachuanensis]